MKCDVCGSSDIIKENGEFVCKGCGIKYTLDEIKKMNQSSSPSDSRNEAVSSAASPQESPYKTEERPAFTYQTANAASSVTPAAPAHAEVTTGLIKAAKGFAAAALVISVIKLLVGFINISIVPSLFAFFFTFFAIKTIFSIKRGLCGSDAVKRIPMLLLGWEVYNFVYCELFGGISLMTIAPAIWVILLVLMLIFMAKELPEGKLIKTKITCIIAMLYVFGLQNALCFELEKLSVPKSQWAFTSAVYGTSIFDAFQKNFRLLLHNPFEGFGVFAENSIGTAFSIAFNRYFFLIILFVLIALLLTLFAISRGEVESSTEKETTENKNVLKYSLTAGVCLIFMVFVGGWLLTPLEHSDGSGRGPGSTCMVDGCNNKAVGPTYEFCSKHKKSLDDYWDYQSRN